VPTDEELVRRVKNAFLHDARLSEYSIQVRIENGIATLEGTVQTHRRKLAAQEVAASVDGCRGVVNELEVEPPGSFPDDDVAHHVRAALDAHADITKEVITVSVSAGRVTLNGRVGSNWERTLAEDIALSARGVRSVQNLLTVDLAGEIEDEALSREIQEALSYTRGLRETGVQVAVAGNTAVLSGEVSGLWQKEAAEAVVRRFRVTQVRNELLVRRR
jgi:osmotically-inducible protein OsmY